MRERARDRESRYIPALEGRKNEHRQERQRAHRQTLFSFDSTSPIAPILILLLACCKICREIHQKSPHSGLKRKQVLCCPLARSARGRLSHLPSLPGRLPSSSSEDICSGLPLSQKLIGNGNNVVWQSTIIFVLLYLFDFVSSLLLRSLSSFLLSLLFLSFSNPSPLFSFAPFKASLACSFLTFVFHSLFFSLHFCLHTFHSSSFKKQLAHSFGPCLSSFHRRQR